MRIDLPFVLSFSRLDPSTMADLLPSLSSDEEKDPHDGSDDEENDEINQDFVFAGLLVR
jgi:hypothetical protein